MTTSLPKMISRVRDGPDAEQQREAEHAISYTASRKAAAPSVHAATRRAEHPDGASHWGS